MSFFWSSQFTKNDYVLSTSDVQCTICGQEILNYIQKMKCDLGKLNNKKLANRKMSILQNLLLACNVQHFPNVFIFFFVEEISIFSLFIVNLLCGNSCLIFAVFRLRCETMTYVHLPAIYFVLFFNILNESSGVLFSPHTNFL